MQVAMVSNNIGLKNLYHQWFVIKFKIFVLDYEEIYIVLFHNSKRSLEQCNHFICDYIQQSLINWVIL
jgi:hypothetical protein